MGKAFLFYQFRWSIKIHSYFWCVHASFAVCVCVSACFFLTSLCFFEYAKTKKLCPKKRMWRLNVWNKYSRMKKSHIKSNVDILIAVIFTNMWENIFEYGFSQFQYEKQCEIFHLGHRKCIQLIIALPWKHLYLFTYKYFDH